MIVKVVMRGRHGRKVEVDPRTLPPAERARATRGAIFIPIYGKLSVHQIQPLNPRWREVLQDE